MKNNYLKFLLIFLLIVCGFGTNLLAQNTLSYRTVEELTYHYFVNQQWDSLVETGKAGLHQDIDYYYLRIRMGIAYFNKGKFSRAIQHLNKADRFNSGDSTALEYLYYAYRSFNRPLYQNTVVKRFSVSTRNRVLYKYPLYKNSFVPIMGYQFDQAMKVDDNTLIGRPQYNLYGEIDYPLNFTYFGMDYRHYFGGVALNIAYDHFDSHRVKRSVMLRGIAIDKYNVSEHNLYVNTEVSVKNKLTIIPAVQYQFLKYPKYKAVWNPTDSVYNFPVTDYTYNNLIASLGLYKDAGPFSLGLTVSYSNLYQKKIYQGAFLFTWFPFGNMNLYTTTTAAWLQMPGSGNGNGRGNGKNQPNVESSSADKSHAVFEEAIGGHVWEKLWIEGQFAYNGLRGYNKDNANIVFNNPEQVNFLAGITLVYEVSKVLELSIGYQFSQKELSGMHYTATGVYVLDQYLNNSHLIYGGIKWKL
jgi:hypothetical protein